MTEETLDFLLDQVCACYGDYVKTKNSRYRLLAGSYLFQIKARFLDTKSWEAYGKSNLPFSLSTAYRWIAFSNSQALEKSLYSPEQRELILRSGVSTWMYGNLLKYGQDVADRYLQLVTDPKYGKRNDRPKAGRKPTGANTYAEVR